MEKLVMVGRHRIWVSVQGDFAGDCGVPRDRARPVLLINGFTGNLGTWEPLRRRLDGVETIAYDAPGTGGSPAPCLPTTVPGEVRIAVGLLDTLGYDRVDVVGYSLGGLVAQQLAATEPERVRRLVLLGSPVGWGGTPGSLRALRVVFSPRRLYDRAYYARMLPILLGGGFRHDPELVRRFLELREGLRPDMRGFLCQCISAVTWSTLPVLCRIGQPTLVLSGDDDPLVPLGNSRCLAGRIRHATLQVVAGGGHSLLLDSTEEVMPVIRRFLEAGP